MKTLTMTLVLVGTIASSVMNPAFADRSDWQRQDREEEWHHRKHHDTRYYRFDDHSRVVIYDYYGKNSKRDFCPPGHRKHHDCDTYTPVRYWQIGKPLPRSIHYAELPTVVIRQLPPAPRHYQYIRVNSDILLVALTTGLVVDAIMDIDR